MAEPSTRLTPQEAFLEAATLKAKKHGGGLKLFSGNGNTGLSLESAKLLGVNLGRATVGSFADGESNVRIHENVRGKDVHVLQPTCPPDNNNRCRAGAGHTARHCCCIFLLFSIVLYLSGGP